MRYNFTTSYMRPIMGTELNGTLDEFQRIIEDEDLQIDTVVGRGLSGAMIVPVLARHLGIDFLVVRKKGDGSHAGSRVEGALGRRWAFVDDFYSTGETFEETWNAIEAQLSSPYNWHDTLKDLKQDLRFVGGFFYYQAHFESPETMSDHLYRLRSLQNWAKRTGRPTDPPGPASEAGWSLRTGSIRTPVGETEGIFPPQLQL